MVQVVAALIWDNDRFLACQRPAHKARGLMWEFVGGKVEPGESKEDALRRECREELGVEINIRNIYFEVDHTYPDISIHLTLFNASIKSGSLQLLEHNAMFWMHPSEIPLYRFCPADTQILEQIQEDFSRLTQLEATLSEVSDSKYKEFQCGLMPTVDPSRVLGVRMPKLRQIANKLSKDAGWYLSYMPLRYYEEKNLYGILISECENFDETVDLLNTFLPYVDNWATCDLIVPKSFKKYAEKACQQALIWTRSDHPYTIRFGIGVLMRFGLESPVLQSYADAISSVTSNDYYVKMMIAWYIATGLSVNFDFFLDYLITNKLSKWVHNKAIQKGIESYRISAEQKDILRKLRR